MGQKGDDDELFICLPWIMSLSRLPQDCAHQHAFHLPLYYKSLSAWLPSNCLSSRKKAHFARTFQHHDTLQMILGTAIYE